MTSPRGVKWLGFHLYVREPFEDLLVQCLAPLSGSAQHGGTVRRFFFLRYGESDLHLRLRVLPGRGAGADDVLAVLNARLRTWAPTGEWRLEAHPYDRAELYFGETRESVYAELLNEATTVLALGLLAAPGGESRTRRWLALAALLDILLRGSAVDEACYRTALEASCTFARRTAAAHGRPLLNAGLPPHTAMDASLQAALQRVGPALAKGAAARRAARLLRRARRCGPRGEEVATHALHLLCNKLGFTLHEEHDLFTALVRLTATINERTLTPRARSAG